MALQAQNEVAVLASLDHPNVVKYYECFAERGTQVKIVMELCQVRLDLVVNYLLLVASILGL